MDPEKNVKCCRRSTSLCFHCVFLRAKWSPLKPLEPASWPTQKHSTIEIKTNFMIVAQIIKGLAGFPSKMKAHLFSEVYNLVVNVSFGPKHPRLGFCLEHITPLLEKNGLCVVPLHQSTQGMEGFKLACSCFMSGGSSLLGRTRDGEAGGTGPESVHQLPSLHPSVKWAGSLLGLTQACFGASWWWKEWKTIRSLVPCETWLFLQIFVSLFYLSFQKSS